MDLTPPSFFYSTSTQTVSTSIPSHLRDKAIRFIQNPPNLIKLNSCAKEFGDLGDGWWEIVDHFQLAPKAIFGRGLKMKYKAQIRLNRTGVSSTALAPLTTVSSRYECSEVDDDTQEFTFSETSTITCLWMLSPMVVKAWRDLHTEMLQNLKETLLNEKTMI